jgi:hypothetical protein
LSSLAAFGALAAEPSEPAEGAEPAAPAEPSEPPASEPPASEPPASEPAGVSPAAPPTGETPALPAVDGPAGEGGVDGLSAVQRFRRGEMHFAYGDCQGTVDALAAVAVPGELGDEKQLVEAHRMLAVCSFQLGDNDAVRGNLESLLFIEPDYELDPFRTPPPVMELFDELKQAIKAKLEAIEKARTKPRQAPPAGSVLLVEREVVVRDAPYAAVFLPFGLSQWANGEGVKAIVIGGLQGASLLTNVGGGIAAFAIDAQDQLGAAPAGDEGLAQRTAYTAAWLVSAVGLATLVGAYGYGVADAMWNYEDGAIVKNHEDRRQLSPEEAERELQRLREPEE